MFINEFFIDQDAMRLPGPSEGRGLELALNGGSRRLPSGTTEVACV